MAIPTRIPLHEPSFDIEDGMALLETLRSTWVSTGGPAVDQFEAAFAAFVGVPHAVSVCNGTIAIQLMLECLRQEQGISGPFDVIIPSLTFIATGAAVVHAKGNPVFVDSAAHEFSLSLEAVQATLEERYKQDVSTGRWVCRKTGTPLLAVMAAHIMGWPGQCRAVAEYCEKIGIPYVEDAAESLGSFDADNKHLGTLGFASAFSFNGNKILTTGGGGMLVTRSAKIASLARHLSTTAKTNALRFEHDRVGHNFRLVNILAALGCTQLRKLPDRLVLKKAIFSLYKELLSSLDICTIYEEHNCNPNHWLVNLVFMTEDLREVALAKLNENRVEARPLWTPLHRQQAFADHCQFQAKFPNADSLWKRTLSLPSSPGLQGRELETICRLIKEAF
jgi:perosamine synthetase